MRLTIRLFLFTICFYQTWYTVVSQSKCRFKSSWQPNCERSCDYKHKCESFKNKDCYCIEGRFRNRYNGKCVKPANCPTVRKCPKHSSTSTICERDCHSSKCVTKPNQVCHCVKGYYRHPFSYKCVKYKTCGDSGTHISCVKNSSERLHCERTCANPYCKKRIGRSCYCKAGYTRNLNTGLCIRQASHCPMRTCSHKLKCERACGKTKCEEVKRDCYCTKSFFRHRDTFRCVTSEHCAKLDIDHKQTQNPEDDSAPGRTTDYYNKTTEIAQLSIYTENEMTVVDYHTLPMLALTPVPSQTHINSSDKLDVIEIMPQVITTAP